MAHQQYFSESLMRRYNDMMQENVQLQLKLARQHDEIANFQSQLHRNGRFNGSLPANTQPLQYQIHDLQDQLLIAKERAQTAESRLKDSVARFNSAYAEQRNCIKGLERQLKELRPAGSGYHKSKGRSKCVDNELASTRADLKTTRSNFARLQRQFEAEKFSNIADGCFPVGICGQERVFGNNDRDDDEPSDCLVKQEPEQQNTGLQETTLPDLQGTTLADFQESQVLQDMVPVKAERATKMVRDAPVEASAQPEMVKHESKMPQGFPSTDDAARDAAEDRREDPVIELSDAAIQSTITFPPAVENSALEEMNPHRPGQPTPTTTPRRTRAAKKVKSELEPVMSKARKRRRLHVQELQNELADLDVIELDHDPLRPHKRSRTRTCKSTSVARLKDTFEFKAITEHHPDGEISALDSKEDLRNEIPELWELVHRAHTEWVAFRGEQWKDGFEENKACTEACLSEKAKGRESIWRVGGEGRLACKHCVEHRQPCFAWTGEEFWLLPLHEKDRKAPVIEGEELCWWVNDK